MKKIFLHIVFFSGILALLVAGGCTTKDIDPMEPAQNNTALIVSEENYPSMDALLPSDVIAYEYTNEGHLNKKLYYDAQTGLLKKEARFINDKNGNKLKETVYKYNPEDKDSIQLVMTREFEYIDNRLAAEYIHPPGGNRLLDVKYIYGRNKLDRKIYYRNGEMLYYDTYEYKKDGNIDNVTRYTPSEYIMSWIEYQYGSNKQKSVLKYFDHTGAVYMQEFFHYNSDGELRLVEHEKGLLSGKPQSSVTRYSYI